MMEAKYRLIIFNSKLFNNNVFRNIDININNTIFNIKVVFHILC